MAISFYPKDIFNIQMSKIFNTVSQNVLDFFLLSFQIPQITLITSLKLCVMFLILWFATEKLYLFPNHFLVYTEMLKKKSFCSMSNIEGHPLDHNGVVNT